MQSKNRQITRSTLIEGFSFTQEDGDAVTWDESGANENNDK